MATFDPAFDKMIRNEGGCDCETPNAKLSGPNGPQEKQR